MFWFLILFSFLYFKLTNSFVPLFSLFFKLRTKKRNFHLLNQDLSSDFLWDMKKKLILFFYSLFDSLKNIFVYNFFLFFGHFSSKLSLDTDRIGFEDHGKNYIYYLGKKTETDNSVLITDRVSSFMFLAKRLRALCEKKKLMKKHYILKVAYATEMEKVNKECKKVVQKKKPQRKKRGFFDSQLLLEIRKVLNLRHSTYHIYKEKKDLLKKIRDLNEKLRQNPILASKEKEKKKRKKKKKSWRKTFDVLKNPSPVFNVDLYLRVLKGQRWLAALRILMEKYSPQEISTFGPYERKLHEEARKLKMPIRRRFTEEEAEQALKGINDFNKGCETMERTRQERFEAEEEAKLYMREMNRKIREKLRAEGLYPRRQPRELTPEEIQYIRDLPYFAKLPDGMTLDECIAKYGYKSDDEDEKPKRKRKPRKKK